MVTLTDYERTDPDVGLMLQVRDGNIVAFEQLVENYRDRLVILMHQLTRTSDQAEDLTQEVFLRVFRSRERYQPNARFSTWLFTIANNVASNALRTLSRRREVKIALRQRETAHPSSLALDQFSDRRLTPPTAMADRHESMAMVHSAMSGLNDRQREVLELANLQGQSYADTAEKMGLSVPATKSLLARARRNLKVALEPYMRDGSNRKPAATNDEIGAGVA